MLRAREKKVETYRRRFRDKSEVPYIKVDSYPRCRKCGKRISLARYNDPEFSRTCEDCYKERYVVGPVERKHRKYSFEDPSKKTVSAHIFDFAKKNKKFK